MPAPVIRSRIEVDNVDNYPGPGMYDQNTKWKGNAVAWRPATNITLKDEQPVPSALEIKFAPARSTTMSFRLKPLTKENIPGPGAYEIDGQFSPYRQRAFTPRGTFGSGRASTRDTEKTPGPGAYLGSELSPRSRLAGPSLKGRLAVPTTEVPGPGAYDHKGHMGTGLTASFKGDGTLRMTQRINEVPGPGAYDLHTTIGSNA